MDMQRRSGFGLSMLLMSLWMGQTALAESRTVSLAMGISAVTLAFFGGGVLSGYFEPEAIPDEKMSTLSSRILVAMLVVGAVAVLLILALQYR
jgi:hypothetical protein